MIITDWITSVQSVPPELVELRHRLTAVIDKAASKEDVKHLWEVFDGEIKRIRDFAAQQDRHIRALQDETKKWRDELANATRVGDAQIHESHQASVRLITSVQGQIDRLLSRMLAVEDRLPRPVIPPVKQVKPKPKKRLKKS